MEEELIKTLADTIVWVAEKRMEHTTYQNKNSAIHAVLMEINLILMADMLKEKIK